MNAAAMATMGRFVPALLLCAALGTGVVPAQAAEPKIGPRDTVETILVGYKDKRVTIRLGSGQELTGTVKTITPKMLHLGAIAGRELFDAFVPLDQVEVILIRTKE